MHTYVYISSGKLCLKDSHRWEQYMEASILMTVIMMTLPIYSISYICTDSGQGKLLVPLDLRQCLMLSPC